MGKIILSEFISLDGIAQNPSWAVPYWGEDIAAVKLDELIDAEALLLGKNTFDMFALAWPGKSDADGYADRINAMPKYVVTSHRNPLSWNGVGVLADPDELRNLKAKTKGNLLVIGSLSLVHLLLEEKLADEVRIFLYPLLVKEGRKLFESLESDFELVSQQSFQSGVVELRYKVK